MKLEEIQKEIEALSDSEKRRFFSEIIPEICDESLTTEGCRMIFEKKLSRSRYLESFDALYKMQKRDDSSTLLDAAVVEQLILGAK